MLPIPPRALKKRSINSFHGKTLIDDYAYLRDKEDPAVIEYLEMENNYTDSVMKSESYRIEKIKAEFLSRMKEDDVSVAEKVGDYFYYSRTEKGCEYRFHERKVGSMDGEVETVLDENAIAAKEKFFRLGGLSLCPCGKKSAYITDTTGYERYNLYVSDIATKEIESTVIENVADFEWCNSEYIIYTIRDDANRPHKAFLRKLGTKAEDDILIYEEEDEAYELYVQKTRDEKYIILLSESTVTTEARLLDAKNPLAPFRLVYEREYGVEYYLSHREGIFYLTTNKDAPNFKVLIIDENTFEVKDTFREHNENVLIERLECFKDFVVLYEMREGNTDLFVYDCNKRDGHIIKFEEPAYSVSPGRNTVFNKKCIRFSYSSLVSPRTVYDYDMEEKKLIALKTQEVGGYNKNDYTSERLYAITEDGESIPISLVYKKPFKENSFCYLVGYGAYGISYPASFDSKYISLLDRGFVYAIAHIRGGQEKGRKWYEAGKFLNKTNTFTDFIDVADRLVSLKYTTHEKLAIGGGSAGGLLMGAVMNMRGESLCKTCVSRVPFVDSLNTMLDASLPLTVTEYDEWGNPNNSLYFDYMHSYAPYENIKKQNYPNILFTTALNDSRVGYWESVKFIAKLREYKTDSNTAIVKIDMKSGHGGVSGRYNSLKEIAFNYAFILKTLGISD